MIIEKQGSDYVITGVKNSDFSEEVNIPNFITKIADNAFESSFKFTKITIPDSVTSIGSDTFRDCSELTSITIPDSVTSIGDYAFYNTTWYNNQPDGVVYAGKVAYKYKGEMPENTSIILKNDTLGIADFAFSWCLGLTSITIPDSVTSIGSSAFSYCRGLTSITIPDSVTSIGNYAFRGCSGLESITIPFVGATKDGTGNPLFGYIFSSGNSVECNDDAVPSSLKTVIIIGGKHIGGSAFSGCSGLTSITIPDSVTSIGDYAFFDCSGLTNITIPDSITSIGEDAFVGCSKLKTVIIDSSEIAKLSDSSSYLLDYAETVYVKEGIEVGSYITNNFTLAESSDMEGYVKYIK